MKRVNSPRRIVGGGQRNGVTVRSEERERGGERNLQGTINCSSPKMRKNDVKKKGGGAIARAIAAVARADASV